ncbi:peptide-methionine (S)-S-oxide reductase MsrA [Novosphingobium sp. ZN18A2]|uniref:peptide-methionine (S)-S-oxide reductase MsrA n=1 Tax=Novosphingobium sp. ZN18A2 TaxID=3079861 RepID=UPI0030D140C9
MTRAARIPLAAVMLTAACHQPAFAESAVATPAAVVKAHESSGPKAAIFAGGCFWGVEAVFSHVKGVSSVVSGYEGGAKADARYERVSRGDTGLAESVRVTYDPSVVRYDQLLQIYFGVIADPTELNRQGPDTGTQYRSALVPLDKEQRRAAAGYIAQLKALKLWDRPIVTAIEPYRGFYPAERYHQDFMQKHPDHPYIVMWDKPKVRALKRLFPALYKASFTGG